MARMPVEVPRSVALLSVAACRAVAGSVFDGAAGTEWVLVLFVGLLAGAAICAFRAD